MTDRQSATPRPIGLWSRLFALWPLALWIDGIAFVLRIGGANLEGEHYRVGTSPLPDWLLVGLLGGWDTGGFVGGPAWIQPLWSLPMLVLAVFGAVGWGVSRFGGARGGWAGLLFAGGLKTAAATAATFGYMLVPNKVLAALEEAGGLALFAPLLAGIQKMFVAAASIGVATALALAVVAGLVLPRGMRWRLAAQMALAVAVVLILVGAVEFGVYWRVPAWDRPAPYLPVWLALSPLLYLPVLHAFRAGPGRWPVWGRRWAFLAVFLAVAGLAGRFRYEPVVPPGFEFDTENRHATDHGPFSRRADAGSSAQRFVLTESMRLSPEIVESMDWAEGDEATLLRLVMPPALMATNQDSPSLNHIYLRRFRHRLTEVKAAYLSLGQTNSWREIDALLLETLMLGDALATEAEIQALVAAAKRHPHMEMTRIVAATVLFERGRHVEAAQVLEPVVAAHRRSIRLHRLAGACGEDNCDDPAKGYRLGRVNIARGWPLFSQRWSGVVRVRWNLPDIPGLADDLYVAAVPLRPPEAPACRMACDALAGPRRPVGGTSLLPIVDGETVIGPLPGGRYLLRVGFREGKHPDMGWAAVTGLPTEPIVIGPGFGETLVTLHVWATNPLLPSCEGEMVVWPRLEGASAYLLQSWERAGGGAHRSGQWRVSSPPWDMEEMAATEQSWPGKGLRVVAIGGKGEVMLDPLPLTVAGSRRLGGAEDCFGDGVPGRWRSP